MLLTALFWREVLARATRNAVQIITPALALAAGGQLAGLDWQGTVVAAGLGGVLVVLKTLAGITATPGAPWWVHAVERAVGAAAASVLAWWPADWLGLVHMDWSTNLKITASAVGLSLLQLAFDPPPGVGPVVAGELVDGGPDVAVPRLP